MKTLFLIGVTLGILHGQLAAMETVKLVPALGWELAKQGGFPTSIAADAQNAIWVGTEGNGVWRYDPREKSWSQFTTKEGLGDDCVYAVAVDKLNRVWVGHLNHGVSVWNGEKWKNYGFVDGPLGARVFAIAISPLDGDVWMATDCGLARFSVAGDRWDYFTRASGLPANEIQCLAFSAKGDIFVGTQCEGIATAKAAEQYRTWSTITGPRLMPNTDTGIGLATNLINDLLTAPPPPELRAAAGSSLTGAATPLGIAGSDGTHWGFMRGADWKLNVSGLLNAPAPEPKIPASDQKLLPMEDWVTCLRQDPQTRFVWIGYRQKGFEVRSPEAEPLMVLGENGELEKTETGEKTDESVWVRTIWLGPNAPPLLAVYGDANGGLKTLENSSEPVEPGKAPGKASPFPAVAKPAEAASFLALSKHLETFENELQPGDGVFLGDDWRTQGDWIGRYGHSFAMLCGVTSPTPARVFASSPDYQVQLKIGPHQHPKSAEPYTYISKPTSENPSVLYDPILGHRREAEINDGSFSQKDYPLDWQGPDLWVDVQVPAGLHCLSLYFHNSDSQAGPKNKLRDYDLQLLPWSEIPKEVETAEPLARARVTDFWGGVYKMFVVAGPSRFVVRVGRNRSFVTKLQGVFLDQINGLGAAPLKPLPGFENAEYPSTDQPAHIYSDNESLAAAAGFWEKLDETLEKRGTLGLQIPLRIWAYRAALAQDAPSENLTQWRWQIGLWTLEDRSEFKTAMARAFEAYSKATKELPKP